MVVRLGCPDAVIPPGSIPGPRPAPLATLVPRWCGPGGGCTTMVVGGTAWWVGLLLLLLLLLLLVSGGVCARLGRSRRARWRPCCCCPERCSCPVIVPAVCAHLPNLPARDHTALEYRTIHSIVYCSDYLPTCARPAVSHLNLNLQHTSCSRPISGCSNSTYFPPCSGTGTHPPLHGVPPLPPCCQYASSPLLLAGLACPVFATLAKSPRPAGR